MSGGPIVASPSPSPSPSPSSSPPRDLDETSLSAGARIAYADTVAPADDPAAMPTRISGRGPVGSGRGAAGHSPLPRRIGRFAILRRLGSGGMGTVYAGFDEALGRRVAIKVLHIVDGRGAGGRAMLQAEAQAMARLSHAHVVQIYELGEHEGQIFLVMEYIDGETLSEWLAAGDREWRSIVAIFVAAGEGLAAAHRAGIIHRDFKPDNVLLDPGGVAKVADFGLARASEEGQGQIAGTPGYMSPEQFLGEATDARSDVFSFAVALHRALYGASPFAGATLEELRQSVTEGVLAPTGRIVGPPRLRAVIARGLQRRPEDRYPSMDALLGELRRFLPVGARRRGSMIAGAVALVALGITAFTLMRPGPGPSPAAVAGIARDVYAAHRSAEQAEWVYPADEAAAARTAIRRIVDLEHVDGPAAELARREADALRGAFARELAEIGGRYWDDERTRPFARDFYAQTLMFQPDHAEALRRGRLTPGQLADLRAQAEASTFSPEQLAAAAPLRALADVDNVDLEALLAGLHCGCTLGQVGGGGDATPAASAPASPGEPEGAGPEGEDVPVEEGSEATPEESVAAPSPPSNPRGSAPASTPRAARTGTGLRALLEQAKGARSGGEDGEATRLFSQVLALDPENDTALGALSDLAFDRGEYHEAAALAERAAAAAPTVARHHLRRGDASFKLGRRGDARASYERALELGEGRGRRRLEILEEEAP